MDEPTSFQNVEQVDAAIKGVRENAGLSGERQGEQLLPLYKRKVELQKAAAPQSGNPAPARENGAPVTTEPVQAQTGEVAGDPVRQEFANSWGSRFDQNSKVVGEAAEEVFQTPERFQTFLKTSGLDTASQIQAIHGLHELISMPIVPSELPSEALGDAMHENFSRFSGSNYERNLKDATRAAERIFGGWDNADSFFIKHGWDQNPQVYTHAMTWLSQVGRRLK